LLFGLPFVFYFPLFFSFFRDVAEPALAVFVWFVGKRRKSGIRVGSVAFITQPGRKNNNSGGAGTQTKPKNSPKSVKSTGK
jgi:hypothetical protein